MHPISPPPEGSASYSPRSQEACERLPGARYSDWVLVRLSRETTSGRFIPQMDGLRFIAIGMVIFFHVNAYLMAKAPYYEQGTRDWLCRAALVGSHGVELFFVISGFILALPFATWRLGHSAPVNLRRYYLRRVTRLEPPYIVTLLVMSALMYCVHPAGAPLGSHVAASLFYLHNLIYGSPSTALGVAWSLEIEVQFYLLMPVLALLFTISSSAMRRSVIALLALMTVAAQTEILRGSPRFQLSIFGYLQFFLIGFLLADFFLIEWKIPSRRPALWDAFALFGWPALFLFLQSDRLRHWVFPALTFLLYCAAFRGRWTSRILSLPWITAIGGMCYSIYLIHYEVISAAGRVSKSFGERLPNPLFLFVQLAIVGFAILVVCGAYFIVLERPCMKRDWPSNLRKRMRTLIRQDSAEVELFAD